MGPLGNWGTMVKGVRNSCSWVCPGGVNRWSYKMGCKCGGQSQGWLLHGLIQTQPPFRVTPQALSRKQPLPPWAPFSPVSRPPTMLHAAVLPPAAPELLCACASLLSALQFQAVLDSLLDFPCWRQASPSSATSLPGPPAVSE